MELNNCENGSLNMEINDDEEILRKNKTSLHLKPAEIDCSISSEENTDDNITGKNKSKVWSKPLNNRTLGVWFIIHDTTLDRSWPGDSVLGSSLTQVTRRPFVIPSDPMLKRQNEDELPRPLFLLCCSGAAGTISCLCWLFRECEYVTGLPLCIPKSFELRLWCQT